jgi:serine kinase of HPr protein (carbohydrate metabolism regulator)
MSQPKAIIHATSVCAHFCDGWRGILLMGPSGSGKSDLGLRALQAGFQLISDDYSLVFVSQNALFATAPATIAEKMEVRGAGIINMPRRLMGRIGVVAHLQTTPVERMPQGEITAILGLTLPTVRINPFEASAVAKLTLALTTIGRTR